jgi:hypothetical protein
VALEALESRNLLDAPDFSAGEIMGIIEYPAIIAASGLVTSRR